MKKQYTIEDLLDILVTLRGENGCPWDRVQTHESIKKDMIEEAYEAIDALQKGDDKAFANELGDVLLQVVFHSQIAKERGAFEFNDVLNEICEKLISRHTHVFGDAKAENTKEALNEWEKNKKKEKALDTYTDNLKDVPKYLPALMRAQKVQKRAAEPGFDFPDAKEALLKLEEEIKELKQAMEENSNIEEEFGDLLFSAVNTGRLLGITAETALSDATEKFIDRFDRMEKKILSENLDFKALNLDEMDEFWKKIK